MADLLNSLRHIRTFGSVDRQRLFLGALIILVVLGAIRAQQVHALTAGPNYASSGANNTATGTIAWTSPGNATTDNATYASISLGKNAIGNYLVATGFGFSIPTGSTIDGITAEIERYTTDTSTRADLFDNAVRIVKGGTIGATDMSSATAWSTTSAYTSYGGTTNLWGDTWTASDINATNFGVALSVKNTSSGAGGTETGYVDAVRVTISYTAPPTYTQSGYRVFNNADSTDVGSALSTQNSAASLAAAGDSFRVRVLMHLASNLALNGQTFKLQYAAKGSGTCAAPSGGTPSSYTDVTTGTLIAFNNNTTPADGATLTGNANDPTHSGHTVVNQTYEEANNFSNSVGAISSGQDGMWDFALKDNGAAAGATYCLRIVKSDGTTTDMGFDTYPEVTAYVTPPDQSTIDSAAYTTHYHKTTQGADTVFISDTTGYTFYRETDGTCVYSKTTNSGASWGTPVVTDGSTGCFKPQIWYDRWTPGDSTGTVIHIITIDTTYIYYNSLDTSSDTLSQGTTPVNISGASANTWVTNQARPTITKSTSGVIYAGGTDAGTGGDTSYVKKCSTTCGTASNWSDSGLTDTTLGHDEYLLMPLSGGDILLIMRSTGPDDMLSKVYDEGTTTWDSAYATIDASAVEYNASQDYRGNITATVDKKTGKIYLAYIADQGTLGTGNDIRTATYSSGGWTTTSDILTDSTMGLLDVSLAFDENTASVYAVYLATTDPATITTGNIYWKKSTDDMVSWGSQSSAINTSAGDFYGVHTNVMSDERIYATWQDIGDVLYGAKVVNLTPPTYSQAAYRVFANADSTDVGAALAVQDSAATLGTAGDAFRVRKLIHVAGDGIRSDLHQFKLQYAAKGSGTCAAPSGGTPSSYTDVTTGTLIAFNNNTTPADGATLTGNANDPTHSGHTRSNQSYEEANNFSNTVSAITGGHDGVWDFALKDNGAAASTSYCLRVVKSDGTVLGGYDQYAEIQTAAGSGTDPNASYTRGGQSVVNGLKNPFSF